jgi:hypothetical protein
MGLGLPPAARVLAELRLRYAEGRRHLHADHRIPIGARPDLRLDLDNLQTLCNECNDRKSAGERVSAVLPARSMVGEGAVIIPPEAAR